MVLHCAKLRFTFVPIVIAFDLGRISTMCDDLIEALNAKCIEDIGNRGIIAPLIETLNMVNGGQGLGVSDSDTKQNDGH